MNPLHPAWSPDGTKLVFVRYRAQAQPRPRGRVAMFLINANGSGERQLTPWALRAGDHPDWSPSDGERILFAQSSEGGPERSLEHPHHPTRRRRLDESSPEPSPTSSTHPGPVFGGWQVDHLRPSGMGPGKDERANVHGMRGNRHQHQRGLPSPHSGTAHRNQEPTASTRPPAADEGGDFRSIRKH